MPKHCSLPALLAVSNPGLGQLVCHKAPEVEKAAEKSKKVS